MLLTNQAIFWYWISFKKSHLFDFCLFSIWFIANSLSLGNLVKALLSISLNHVFSLYLSLILLKAVAGQLVSL